MIDGRSRPGPFLHVESAAVATRHGPFTAHVLWSLERRELALAVVRGDVTGDAPLLARVHSACLTSEVLGACDCDCAPQLDASLRAIADEGRGVLFYLMQEGRGAGLTAKSRDRMLVQASAQRVTTFEAFERLGLPADLRRYDEVADLARWLGLRAPLVLLTNNPDKLNAVERALERVKLEVSDTRPLRQPASPFNVHYLASKHRSGHALEADGEDPEMAPLPEPVRWLDPTPLPEAPELVATASYLLPIPLPREGEPAAPAWLRMGVVVDLAGGEEIVTVSTGRPGGSGPAAAVRIQRTGLLERLPLVHAPRRAALRAALAEIRARGRGCLVLPARPESGRVRPGDARAPALLAVLADWAGDAPLTPLRVGDGADPDHDALRRSRLRCGPSHPLASGR